METQESLTVGTDLCWTCALEDLHAFAGAQTTAEITQSGPNPQAVSATLSGARTKYKTYGTFSFYVLYHNKKVLK